MPTNDNARTPLLDVKQRDQALRDLMPVVEWLTNADLAFGEGMQATGLKHLAAAMNAFREMPHNSPAVKAYIRWLEENTRRQ